MKKINFLFKSFQIKVTLILILCMLIVSGISNYLIYKIALDSQFSELRNKLIAIAQTSALLIDTEMLLQVPLNKDGINSPEYKIIVDKLKKIKRANPQIKYIYTLMKTDQEGIWQFVVDPNLISKEKDKKKISSYPGDKYEAKRFPEMMKAFYTPAADKKLEIDEWGTTLSGYAPIYDESGEAVAVLGVDIIADDVYKTRSAVHKRAYLVLISGILISIILGILFSRRINKPIKKLVKGISCLSEGNLQCRVEVSGDDEIAKLAEAFNKMSNNLFESRKNLVNYFYSMVQSLIRILEAKDHYTRGHSERVSNYVEQIALKMNFPQQKIEALKEIALLHDIGKLGIKENILNKKGNLTEEEWEIIKTHCVVGEEILKPVMSGDDMLKIVRQHHERYDGSGYPDGMMGDNINIMASIVSVADAYDAMTSPRSYRPSLSKEEAITEIKKNSGTQFNPKVVEVFLQI